MQGRGRASLPLPGVTETELTEVYHDYVGLLPHAIRRLVDGAALWVFSDYQNTTPGRPFSQMSSVSSRGPSSATENDSRVRNNRTSGSTGPQPDTPPPSPGGSSERGSKACCFCWCCCCSCSWTRSMQTYGTMSLPPASTSAAHGQTGHGSLTVKNGEDSRNPSTGTNLGNLNEKEEPPSAEDIKSWSESFDKLMSSNAGRKVFREFLRSEYSEENMLFYLACEELKKEENPEVVEEKARLIYEDYISILSPKEVSLDSRVREVINRNMVDPTPHTFDEAQLQIYTLMHRDSYPRFLNSQIYKRLVQ